MATSPTRGYRELEHTADWELEVWAPDLASLCEQAALGMYDLSGVRLAPDKRVIRELEFHALDREGLLVTFLTELLYLGEVEDLGFDTFEISIENNTVKAQLSGAPLISVSKEIKAVTYHNLTIFESPSGLKAKIVFDV